MAFASVEDAWTFWVNYGGIVGFGVRKQLYTQEKRWFTFFLCVGLLQRWQANARQTRL
jgi:DMSO/TMAO reductase YedYZ heme-binding membrane subunit